MISVLYRESHPSLCRCLRRKPQPLIFVWVYGKPNVTRAQLLSLHSTIFFHFFFFHAGCFYFGLIPRGLFLCIRLECMFPSFFQLASSLLGFAMFLHVLAWAPRALLLAFEWSKSCDVREVVWRPLATLGANVAPALLPSVTPPSPPSDFYFRSVFVFLASRRFCFTSSSQIVYSGSRSVLACIRTKVRLRNGVQEFLFWTPNHNARLP